MKKTDQVKFKEEKLKMDKKNIVAKIRQFGGSIPEKLSCVYLQDEMNEVETLTYKELNEEAEKTAVFLIKKKAEAGPIIILLPAGLDFVCSFIGCLYAGIIAVPVHCPKLSEFEKSRDLIAAIAKDSNAVGVIINQEYLNVVNALFAELKKDKKIWIATAEDIIKNSSHTHYQPRDLDNHSPAYLQYTSGSTSLPKGVMTSHLNLTHSLEQTAKAWHYTQNSIMVSWAPHTHVYGLVCGLLLPLYYGSTVIILSPAEFIKKPITWLRAIDQYNATHSGCPNFGYDYSIESIDSAECVGLNLKTWKVAVNGGEFINEGTLLKFFEKFSPYGFGKQSFHLAYGMSEVTGLIASHIYDFKIHKNKKNKKEDRSVLSVGKPLYGLKAVVVDPETLREMKEGKIGEIWLKEGDSISSGYWHNLEATEAVFNFKLTNSEETYFRTGDSGYIKNSAIFLVSRLKELIIVHGKKYSPIDLELTSAHAHPNLNKTNGAVAFWIENAGKEQVILAQELISDTSTTADFKKIVKAIRRAITETHQIDLYGVILLSKSTLPRTSSGKLQRKECQQQYLNDTLPIIYQDIKVGNTQEENGKAMSELQQKHAVNQIKQEFIQQIANVLSVPADVIHLEDSLSEYGFDSINIVQLMEKLNQKYALKLGPDRFFEYKTLNALFAEVLKSYSGNVLHSTPKPNSTLSKDENNKTSEEIAIIGMHGIFPGAENLEQFWGNLENGKESITRIPEDRWDNKESYIKWGGFIQDIDKFDAKFFNISRYEAELMDPQQRLFLQTVWKTIEDAGYAPGSLKNRNIGIFVGASSSDYNELIHKHDITEAHSITGAAYCLLANRISYLLDLEGPSEAIDTACSSSLVAIHHAIQAIRQGDCEMAIAGGLNALLTPTLFQVFNHSKMLAEDGHCKTFDASADGYVRGEGVGAIFLKTKEKALADGDHIYGLIKASAVNHGGHVKSLTVPNPIAQSEVIAKAITRANVEINTITYIEAHGTGTSLGDPIEISGLKKAFNAVADKQNIKIKTGFCKVGSVKTNIGHLEAAAGMAGVIKVLLAMKYQKIPATLHLTQLNPNIHIEETPFYFPIKTEEWKKLTSGENKIPRRAGVSSFGFGGMNCHVILEEGPEVSNKSTKSTKPFYLIALSAKSQPTLQKKIEELEAFLNKIDSSIEMQKIAINLNCGRDHFQERIALIANSKSDLQQKLNQLKNHSISTYCFTSKDANKVRLANEGFIHKAYEGLKNYKELSSKEYLTILEEIAQAYIEGVVIDWSRVHFNEAYLKISLPSYPFDKERYWINPPLKENKMYKTLPIQQEIYYQSLKILDLSTLTKKLFKVTINKSDFFLKDHVFNDKILLPAVFYIEMATRIGMSLFEQQRTCLKIRKITFAVPVFMEKDQLSKDIFTEIFIKRDSIKFEVYTELKNQKVIHSWGHLSTDEFTEADSFNVQAVKSRMKHSCEKTEIYDQLLPKVKFYLGPSFRSIEKIDFYENELLAQIRLPDGVFEVESEYVLHPGLLDAALHSGIVLDSVDLGSGVPFTIEEFSVYGSLDEAKFLYAKKTKILKVGIKEMVFFDAWILNEHGNTLVRFLNLCMKLSIDLVNKLESKTIAIQSSFQSVSLPDYYKIEWQEKNFLPQIESINASTQKKPENVLIFCYQKNAIGSLRHSFSLSDILTIEINFGEQYQVLKEGLHYIINPSIEVDYKRLLDDLKQINIYPDKILYLTGWNGVDADNEGGIEASLESGFYTLFLFIKSLMASKISKNIDFLYGYPEQMHSPIHAMVMGFCKTLIQENPHYHCNVVGISSGMGWQEISHLLKQEFINGFLEKMPMAIRYSHQKRFIQTARPFKIEPKRPLALRRNGVYLITGGLGEIGLIVAKYLAENHQAKLVLAGRSSLSNANSELFEQVKSLGAEAEYVQADISKQDDVRQLIHTAKQHFGSINGIFHCAGINQDSLIIKKSLPDLAKVVAPKVKGTFYLDLYTRDEPLDYFVLFSSIASFIGNMGQGDYATANAYMDYFAEWRNEQVKVDQRRGHTISINWPVWEEGGIKMDVQIKEWMQKTKGFTPMTTQTGLDALIKILMSDCSQVAVMTGDHEKMQKFVLSAFPPLNQNELHNGTVLASAYSENMTGTLSENPAMNIGFLNDVQQGRAGNEKTSTLIEEIKQMSAELLKEDVNNIQEDINMSQYGVDSIISLAMLNKLESRYDIILLPTIFEEYPTIRSLANYISKEINQKAVTHTSNAFHKELEEKTEFISMPALKVSPIPKSFLSDEINASTAPVKKIAIIGAACRFPQSPDLETYWDNLVHERRLIRTGIPSERWNHALYYSADKSESMKTYANWGGFVEGVDLFDPSFFGINEADAYGIDPQQRIMLELTQELFDRAGYTREEINGKAVSVILGAGESHYIEKYFERIVGKTEAHQIVNRIPNMIASRISDFYNLSAYSHTVDAACSSSMLSIHHACNSILMGEAEMAITGGAEFLINPAAFVGFSKAGTLSDDGFCYVFDERAKGFVMSEGFGLILLKEFDSAVRDGDQILATILATSVNNDGRTLGLTTPNAKAQKAVIQSALARSNVSADSISYLEAHGTGTLLGDPIEIKAAKEAYSEHTNRKNYCAVASVKSNMGHTLHSAGIASIIKVVLALKNKFIPATLHCERPHKRFQFEDSPFYPITKGKVWGSPFGQPRRAASSSFAFGGTNAHIILEEYIQPLNQITTRLPLPPTKFNRRSFWLGDSKDGRKEILRHLSAGRINSIAAVQLLRTTL